MREKRGQRLSGSVSWQPSVRSSSCISARVGTCSIRTEAQNNLRPRFGASHFDSGTRRFFCKKRPPSLEYFILSLGGFWSSTIVIIEYCRIEKVSLLASACLLFLCRLQSKMAFCICRHNRGCRLGLLLYIQCNRV